jgi:tetratricopeptide (TPR) repeat protein
MRLRSLLLFLLFLFHTHEGSAQSLPHIEMRIISNEQESELNIEKKEFTASVQWMKPMMDSMFGLENTKRDFMLLITLHTEKDPELSLYARPALTEEQSQKFTKAFSGLPKVRTHFVDYSYVFLIRTNEGSGDAAGKFYPDFRDPYEKEQEKFKRAGLMEKNTLLKDWAMNDVLPLLAEATYKVDEKFSGVRYMGKTLKTIIAHGAPTDIAKITDSTTEYWRGVMEMSPGNEIIPLSKVMLLVAKGEFDMAKEYCDLLKLFNGKKMLASYYIDELSWRLEEFNKELVVRTQRGIEQSDRGNYEGAIAVYHGILKEYPRSAWVNYELYYSTNMQNMLEKKDSVRSLAEWNKAKPIIYGCDPFYPVVARITNGKEGYVFTRRVELGGLFKVKENFSSDILRFGDIALDLGADAYAAEVYWLCFSRLKKEDLNHREMLPYFLYTLDKLGVKNIRKAFEGDFEKEFKKIDKLRKRQMEQSDVYKSFKKH